VALPPSICNNAPSVIGPVNFNHNFDVGRKKVHDVAVANEHLPPKATPSWLRDIAAQSADSERQTWC